MSSAGGLIWGMGIRQTAALLAAAEGIGNVVNFPGTGNTTTGRAQGIVTPWADQTALKQLVYADVLGADQMPVTRAAAMQAPAVAGGRGRIIEQIAGRGLYAVKAGAPTPTQPSWLYRSDSGVSPWHRMAGTLDDLIFFGWSLWVIARGADGFPIDAIHWPFDRWSIDADTGVISVDQVPQSAEQVILIPGPHDGLLNIAAPTIRGALQLQRTVVGRASTPAPVILLQETEDNGMTQEEAQAYVRAVAAARRDPDGAVMFVPHSITATVQQDSASDAMENARNAIRTDLANFLNLPVDALDGTKQAGGGQMDVRYQGVGSTPSNLDDRMRFWTEPIEARLSLDDCVPRGTAVRFDFSAPSTPTGTPTED